MISHAKGDIHKRLCKNEPIEKVIPENKQNELTNLVINILKGIEPDKEKIKYLMHKDLQP